MSGLTFRSELERRLRLCERRILLRVAIHGDVEVEPVELTGSQILERSYELANRCTSCEPGRLVLLLLPHSTELFLLHLGLVLTNRVPAILAWPTSRVDPEKYQTNLVHQLRNLPAAEIITLPSLSANLEPYLPYRTISCAIDGAETWDDAFAVPLQGDEPSCKMPSAAQFCDPGDGVFLQFSGGTTGSQKAVLITTPMLIAQLDRLSSALAFTSADSVCSWLPMYHDMGLIACFWLPLWNGASSLQMAASHWLLHPSLLFHFMERYKGTFCWLPNFAFSYLAARRSSIEASYSLTHVRAWINCSEPVKLRSVTAFTNTFSDWGVRRESIQASYAMAENVFAVTQTILDCPLKTFPRSLLSSGESRPSLSFDVIDDVYVSSGSPLEGMRMRIIRPDGSRCGDAEPGEIQLRTESLFSGYWQGVRSAASSFTPDGWHATGDYGFLAQGELFVIGRLKDIIIVGGQNVFPEDIEMIINSLPGVYPGRVVAFGVYDNRLGTEILTIVAEMRSPFSEERAELLEREIQKTVFTAIGIAPRTVAVMPERWIVKSTAGKISRRETRERFMRELPQRYQPKNAEVSE